MRLLSTVALLAACSAPTTPTTERPVHGAPDAATLAPPVGEIHLQLGVATDGTPDDDYLLRHEHFVASYNPYLNAANWVSYRTTPDDFGPVPRYAGPFYPDDTLPAAWFHPDTSDLFGSGFDRGHMLRSEERTSTAEANIATFVMSNVIPQTADLNRGPWFDFELHVQRRIQRDANDAYEISGPIWPAACATHAPRRDGDGCRDAGRSDDVTHHIGVPDATFKIVVLVPAGTPLLEAEAPEIEAVVMPNIAGIAEERWWTYRSTVADIEARTGYDFLAALDAP